MIHVKDHMLYYPNALNGYDGCAVTHLYKIYEYYRYSKELRLAAYKFKALYNAGAYESYKTSIWDGDFWVPADIKDCDTDIALFITQCRRKVKQFTTN